MDRSIDVRTPESIAFTYELAGLGSRWLAVVVDMLLQVLVSLGLFFGLAYAATRMHPPAHALSPGLERLSANLVAGFFIFLGFAIFFGYFMLFEALWNGQTPGKRMLGIRVVRDGGYPVDFSAALVRNLIRVGELAAGVYLVAAVCALLSPENKRLGDLAAGTIVVRDAKSIAPADLLRELATEPQYAPTLYLTGEERAIVRRFIERRDVLAPERRRALASQLADRVRPRVGPDLARLDDEGLLERL